MFTKEGNGRKEKYRVVAIYYIMANSEEEALNLVTTMPISDADEKRITKMRRN